MDDGAALFGIDEAAFGVAPPIARGAGQHDVARFGIDQDVLDSLQAGQR